MIRMQMENASSTDDFERILFQQVPSCFYKREHGRNGASANSTRGKLLEDIDSQSGGVPGRKNNCKNVSKMNCIHSGC